MDVQNVNPEEKDENLSVLIRTYNRGEDAKWTYVAKSKYFVKLPNTIIGYYLDENILNIFKNDSLEVRGLQARQGNSFVSPDRFFRLFFEVEHLSDYCHLYHGGSFTLLYYPYKELVKWEKKGEIVKSSTSVLRNLDYQLYLGCGYGKRGDILDAHILKRRMFFTHEGHAISRIEVPDGYSVDSFINSILAQFTINQYCAQHKVNGYVSLLPMPDYAHRQSDIERIVNEIIDIKRKWFSLDETNLEYHGLIAQMDITTTIDDALDRMQEELNVDYIRYLELVRDNDDLWMDLADIDRGSDFRQTLNDYKTRRPYEELLSIDGASCQNIIDRRTMAQEMVMELVGMAFGRWDTAYAKGEKDVPEFGDVFDALPFMPVVSQGDEPCPAQLAVPADGIMTNEAESPLCLASHVREVMHWLWGVDADDREYELCQLIGCKSLQAYLESPTGFFDYHFKRYTKSRRKAPIYWLLASEDGTVNYWVYYPKLSKNTLPQLVNSLRTEAEALRSRLNAALTAHDKSMEATVRAEQEQVEGMQDELNRIIGAGYVPCHDDGVPVTAAPLLQLIPHRAWRQECEKNMEALAKGDYDWSHLAMSLYPARVTQKAKKDWCLALTHGLEHLCENKPKEKKTRKKKNAATEGPSLF